MTPQEHYDRAEELLGEASKAVTRIRKLNLMRQGEYVSDTAFDRMTQMMDEQGKKAMGIYAQAQVHATLATVPFQQIEVTYAGER